MQSWNLFGVDFVRNIEKYQPVISRQYRNVNYQDPAFLDPLFAEKNTTHYYITPKAVDECCKIKLLTNFRYDWVRAKVDNGLKQWSFGKKMLRFYRYGNTLLILYVKALKADYQLDSIKEIIKERHLLPNVNLDKVGATELKQMGIPMELLPDPKEKPLNYVLLKMNVEKESCEITEGMPKTMPLALEAFMHFRQMLYFILLAPIEFKIVQPGTKHGNRSSNERLVNDEKFPMTIIDCNWNKISVREDGFWVSGEEGIGFSRQQKYGPGYSLTKEIWIDPFPKEGYIRGATKDEKK